jgi:hypothetical protein
MKSWTESGALTDWRRALGEIKTISFAKDSPSPQFQYDGTRGQIPRGDMPYGTLRWQGTSGDRGVRARSGSKPSPDYMKICMPQWAFELAAAPLSPEEQAAVDKAPQ